MKSITPLLALSLILGLSAVAKATPLLGDAAGYNAFALSNMNVSATDSQGRVAAGVSFTSSNFSIGSKAESSQYSLVGGGSVNYQHGTIDNGGIFAEGDADLDHHTVNGDVRANGDVVFGSGGGTVTGATEGNANSNGPLDFDYIEGYLQELSSDLAGMTENGITSVASYNSGDQITLTSNGQDLVNIFYVDGNNLNNATNLNFSLGIDEVAIVNISGTTHCSFSSLGIAGWQDRQGNILYNFYEAADLTISGIGVKGSILAPYASVSFNSGHIDGTLIANSITGGGEYHQFLFNHDIPPGNEPVPEPATMLLFGTGLAGLVGSRLRKNKKE